MKQVNNDFLSVYYLTEEGLIYNKETDKYIKPDDRHTFTLRTIENTSKRIALKTLYKLVYGKIFCIDNIQDLPAEEWKIIPDTDNYYLCSNKGRIKSLKGYEAIILNPYRTKKGYQRVDIVQDGIRVSKLVHRLVACCWLPVPERIDYQLHHIDLNKDNQEVKNLCWLSQKEHSKLHKKEKRKCLSQIKEQ